MATLTVYGTYYIYMPILSFDFMAYRGEDVSISVGKNSYSIHINGTGFNFKGSGIEVDKNKFPTAGNITEFSVTDDFFSKGIITIRGTDVDLRMLTEAGVSESTDDDNLVVRFMFSGSDILNGGIFKDKLNGYGGNDTLIGGPGADLLEGSMGTDTASYSGALKGVVANLFDRSGNTNDAAGDIYRGIENLTGSSHNDKLTGNGIVNVLSGGLGDDVLSAANNDDTLYGGGGADDLFGGSGADIFRFRTLTDSTVAVAGRDTIFDFSGPKGDEIDLHAIDANTIRDGNQTFIYLGTAAFTGKSGELRYIKDASDTYVYGDVNGDRKVDFAIHLDDAVNLSKGYFVL